MQRKLVRFALSAVMIVTALFHAIPAVATDPVGFTSTTIAKGQFGDIDAFSKFVQPVAAPDWTKREIWRSRQDEGTVGRVCPGQCLATGR